MQVSLNVYDVTNTANDNANGVITRLNSITRELNLGGVFHGAVQFDDVEWSFGYCESGTGVYCCRAQRNNLYTFREHIELGVTNKTRQEIKDILSGFKRAWPGNSYDLLRRNCCHFCEELCAALGVPNPPAWLNRFAQGADATVKFTNEASALARRVGSNLNSTAQASALWLRDMSARVMSQMSLNTDTAGSTEPSLPGNGPSSERMRPASAYPSVMGGGGGGDGVVEASTSRCESTGAAGRLTSRLRRFTGGGGAAAAPTTSSLPPSSHASSPDLQLLHGGDFGAQQGSLSLPAVLRQKWQELEATAGDGTKQFLFGLIRTRQAQLDEDDPLLYAGGAASRTNFMDSSSASPHSYSASGAMESKPCEGAAPLATQAPQLQVIGDSLRPATEVMAASVEVCGVDTCTECQPRHDGKMTMITVSADSVGSGSSAGSETGKCGARMGVGASGGLQVARPQPVGHLLDM